MTIKGFGIAPDKLVSKLYHGGPMEVSNPEIRISKFTKDFGPGFYLTNHKPQAVSFVQRRRNWENRIVSSYHYMPNKLGGLNVKVFETMDDGWLDFIANCRAGKPHNYDIVEGPMADDQVWDYVKSYLAGDITRKAFWALAEFRYPTHQICLLTNKALECIEFIGSEVIKYEGQ